MRTHVAFALMFVLMFVTSVQNKLVFIFVALLASLIPDLDSTHSFLGKYVILRPIQWLLKHRGLMHSLTFCVIVALLLDFVWPVLAFPFFLGYSSHILLDSFSIDGIRPFWPSRKEIKGILKTDGVTEKVTFFVLILVDVLLLAYILKVYS